jgi:hypothetical protein
MLTARNRYIRSTTQPGSGIISSQVQSFTEPLLLALQRTNAGPAKSSKEAGTICSRLIHYLMFAHDMKWGDNYLPEDSTPEGNRRRLLQLALYAQHLGTGNTIMCHSIKVATVKAYTNAAASVMALFGDHPGDVRKDVPTDAYVLRVLSTIYDELHRWETIPNRRKPFFPEMLLDVQQRATDAVNCRPPNSLLLALANWFSAPCLQAFACPSSHKTPIIPHPTVSNATCTSMPRPCAWATSGSRMRPALALHPSRHCYPTTLSC